MLYRVNQEVDGDLRHPPGIGGNGGALVLEHHFQALILFSDKGRRQLDHFRNDVANVNPMTTKTEGPVPERGRGLKVFGAVV